MARAAGFDTARRLPIDQLELTSGDRVLIVGAGTDLDLDFLPSNVHVTAIEVPPAMLKHLERRAAGSGRSVIAPIMDARQLAFPDSSFEAVVMHLILAVTPQSERGVKEVTPSLKRRLLNIVAKPPFSDLNRRLRQLLRAQRSPSRTS